MVNVTWLSTAPFLFYEPLSQQCHATTHSTAEGTKGQQQPEN